MIGNVEGARKDPESYNLATEEEINLAAAEMRTLTERDDASVFFYWNRASGIKGA